MRYSSISGGGERWRRRWWRGRYRWRRQPLQGGGGSGAAGGKGQEVDGGGLAVGGGAEAVAELLGGVLLALPVHAGGVAVVDLHAVHADVALAGFLVLGDDAGESDEGASVLRPGGKDGQLAEVDGIAFQDDLFAGGVGAVDDLGEEAADFGEGGQELQFVHEADGRGWGEQRSDAVGDLIKRVGVVGQLHAALGAELVHQDAGSGIVHDVLKEQRGAAGAAFCRGGQLGGAVGDLGHFEVGRDGLSHGGQLAGAVEASDPVA